MERNAPRDTDHTEPIEGSSCFQQPALVVSLTEPSHSAEEAAQVGDLTAVGNGVPDQLAHADRNCSRLRNVAKDDLSFQFFGRDVS